MAYRNGTYVAFHANGTNRPGGNSDIDYYNLMKAWSAKTEDDFTMCNSHDKTAAVRDTSSKARLAAVIHDRLKNSKNMVLIIGETTQLDDDWVPFEIENAIDKYRIPIFATYTGYTSIRDPAALRLTWPSSLAARINNKTAHVLHIPFKKSPLLDAIQQFSHNSLPVGGALGIYNNETYTGWGLV